jgi:hypothetical protein
MTSLTKFAIPPKHRKSPGIRNVSRGQIPRLRTIGMEKG